MALAIGSIGLMSLVIAPKDKIKAESLEIKLKNLDMKECGDTVLVNGIVMYSTENEGSCYYGTDDKRGLWLYPSSFVIELPQDLNLTSIDINYIDYCREGCTGAYLLDKNDEELARLSNTVIGEDQSFEFIEGLDGASKLVLFSSEGMFYNVTLNYLSEN